jgi:hypothetical protein
MAKWLWKMNGCLLTEDNGLRDWQQAERIVELLVSGGGLCYSPNDEDDPYGERFFGAEGAAYNKSMSEQDTENRKRPRKDCTCRCHTTHVGDGTWTSLACCAEPYSAFQ